MQFRKKSNGIAWSSPQTIGTTGNAVNVFPSFNRQNQEVMATWVEQSTNFPTHSIFNGTAWSTPSVIATSLSEGFSVTLFTCYDPLHNQTIAVWPSSPNCDPMYSIFNNCSWSPATFINMEPPGVLQDIFLTYNSTTHEVFATWTDCITILPFFSIYKDTYIPIVEPPTHLRGAKKSNRLFTQTEWYNFLTWKRPSEGKTPVAYRIYRQNLDTLVGEVPAIGFLYFEDRDVEKHKTYVYYIVSVDANGDQSNPASITIH